MPINPGDQSHIPLGERPPMSMQLVKLTPADNKHGEEDPNRKFKGTTFFFRLSVRSKIKPHILMQGDLPLDATTYQAEVLGGALAEQLCEKYDDQKLDPDQTARSAGEMLKEIKLQMEKEFSNKNKALTNDEKSPIKVKPR